MNNDMYNRKAVVIAVAIIAFLMIAIALALGGTSSRFR